MKKITRKDIFKKVLKHEGGYVNISHDRGGETYKGISRKYHPDWNGWTIIDMIKKEDGGIEALKKGDISPIKGEAWQRKLETMVKNFYRLLYWDRIEGDRICLVSYELAYYLFDSAVLLGVNKAVRLLQEAINHVIVDNALNADLLKVDGVLGPVTLRRVQEVKPFVKDVIDEFVKLRVLKHVSTLKHNPSQIIFLEGWIRRALDKEVA